MPTYSVTDPTSGKTIRLTGDSPPSEAELEEIFRSVNSGTKQSPAPWYSERGVNERLAPTTPQTATSFADRLLMPEMNAGKQALRTLLGMAAHPVDTLMAIPNMLKGGVDIAAGIPSEQSDMVRGELDKRGLGLDMSQTAGERYAKAGETLVTEPLTPAMDAAMVYGGVKGARAAAKEWWLPREQAATVEPLEPRIAAEVRQGYEKGVRPTVSGKGSYSATERAVGKQQTAVESIIKNKDNLRLTDEFGEPVKGLPRNLRQFSQAIDQMKEQIFKKYNDMAVRAGQRFVTIDMRPVASAIRQEVGKSVFRNLDPAVRVDALNLAKRLERSELSPVEVQQHIASLNAKLEAYMKAPNPSATGGHTIHAVAADAMRTALDKAISKLEGTGYRALKEEYGALKSIEGEVAHRAVVDARKNKGSIADLIGDMGTAGELAYALSRLDPASLAKAGGWNLVKRYWKHINDPNVVVGKMFGKTEKLMNKRPIEPGEPIPLPKIDWEKEAAIEAEPARAAAEQAAWKAERDTSSANAASSMKKTGEELAALARAKESATGPVVVERNRAAAEQAAWKAANDADAARTAAAVERSAAEVKGMASERSKLTVDRTIEGIPKDREVVLEGVTEKGKKFSYKENARSAYEESKTAIDSLAKSTDVFIEEGDKSIIRVMSRNGVPPGVRATVIRRIRAYLKEGLSNDDAAITAVSDTIAEFDKVRKEVLRQNGIEDAGANPAASHSVTSYPPKR